MSKTSEIQQAYNELINCINEMAKSAGGLNVTDMVAIKGMTDAVIKLKQELATAKQEATAYRISLENLEASLPKMQADAFEAGAEWCETRISRYRVSQAADIYADKLEAGE